ncbi:archease [Dongia sedimenti]|uniref:Archease n=1 Tax=Dongia sedimenti TaxID=3064282 RepID=A0ABU0YS18_9PROT|nr:archease [Rhodospirillaceae bacterium R-7]
MGTRWDGGWEHFEHMADIGVRGFGATKAEAFGNAACALTAAVADLDAVRPLEAVRIECTAECDDLLLYEWLNALIFAMATRKMLFSRFAVRIDGKHLEASAEGEPIDAERHAPAAEAKGATLTALRVAPDRDGWAAQCVVDV